MVSPSDHPFLRQKVPGRVDSAEGEEDDPVRSVAFLSLNPKRREAVD
jgi:hypothetical protein